VFGQAHRIERHNATPQTGPAGQEQWDMQQTLEQFIAPLLRPLLDLLSEGHFTFVGQQREAAHLMEVVRNDRRLNLCWRAR
jgi:hypothetical protein